MSLLKNINKFPDKSLEEVYLTYHGLKTPKCVCGANQKFINTSKGYLGYCSVECKQKTEKYNIENILNIIKTKGLVFSSYEYRKIRDYLGLTSKEIYLMVYPNSNKCIVCSNECAFVNTKVGFLKTCSTKCGNSLPRRKLNGKEKKKAKEKRIKTNLERYGVEHNFQLIDYRGDKNPSHRIEVKEKRKKTMFERYGVEYSLQNPDSLEKYKKTNLERYGETHILKTQLGKQRHSDSMIKNHGVSSPMLSDKIVEKFKKSRLSNFEIRKTDEGTYGFVYITYFKKHSLYKIGLTSDIKGRHKNLKKDFGEYEKVLILESNNCYELESFLHKHFNEKRLVLEDGCGKTEFFNLSLKDINSINNLDDCPSFKLL